MTINRVKQIQNFYLHSKLQTGYQESLQYNDASFLHTMHQPNFPLIIPTSFSIFTGIVSLLGSFWSGTDLKGILSISADILD
ncbi:MAG: hypothetical protein IPK55_11575 [Streptococcus sp.]|nr:hypothetical protein [Streptococcus sp.]